MNREEIWRSLLYALLRFAIIVPGMLGFAVGLIVAPLIIGFRVALELVNTEFSQVFSERPNAIDEDQ